MKAVIDPVRRAKAGTTEPGEPEGPRWKAIAECNIIIY